MAMAIKKIRKEKKHMSLWGIGPIFSVGSFFCSVVGIGIHLLTFPRFFLRNVPLLLMFCPGVLLIAIGLVFWIIAGRQIDAFIIDGKLAENGIYSIVRNPIYSGILFFISGIDLLFRSSLMLPLPILMYIFLRLLLRKEERLLFEVFGETYIRYKERVNSIFPDPVRTVSLIFKRRAGGGGSD